jgi:hypothetical protein
MSFLKDSGIAHMVWDADNYYTNNPIQEAGLFLRKNASWLRTKELNWTTDNFATGEKSIHIIGVPKNAGQVKLAGNIIKELHAGPGFNPDSTAIVLNNEALSVPMLNSLPPQVPDFNFTMGLPLKGTPLYKLLNRLLTLNDNAQKFNKRSNNELKFYHVDVSRVLEHPYVLEVIQFFEQDEVRYSQSGFIKMNNKVFMDRDNILKYACVKNIPTVEFLNRLFEPYDNNPTKAIAFFIFVLDALKETFTALPSNRKGPQLELEYVFHFAKVFNKLKDIYSHVSYLNDMITFRQLVQQIVQSISVPFYGEPLKGVQVMGMLETRLLDFEALVMLSVNEDFIPAGKSGQSIIPNEIRRAFKLPTYEERNAVFAYHFYRLLQRTKKAYLIYNTEADDLGGGDVSRFVTQLKNELPKYNPAIRITEQILTLPQVKISIKPIVVSKNESILNRLDELALSGLSASSLNVYRSCSLRFYYQYVKRIQEAEELEETIEAATLGSVVHDVLRNLYFHYVGKVISEEMLEDMKSKSSQSIQDSFAKHFVGGDINFGKNLLIKHVAESYINKFLQKEKSDLSELSKFDRRLTIVSLEEEFTKDFTIDGLPARKEIRLKGYVDRIDRVGATVRIIDYKTGNVVARDLVFKDWEELATNPKLDKCFQLLFYSYLCADKIDRKEELQSGIISFRNMGGGFMQVQSPDNGVDSDSQFKALLNTILTEIYNPEKAFTQTDELANCAYCPYVSICGR